MANKQTHKPFEVKPKGQTIEELAIELTRDLDDALAARTASELEVAYWWTLYEQGRTRNAKNSPWADAADLTSHIGTEKVDALEARMVKTVFGVEPVFTVEGWGAAERNAPFVEEFHQWQLEAEGFQRVFGRAVKHALVEPVGWLEVYEDTLKRPVRKTITAALQLAPDGSALVGPDLQPLLQMGPNGKYVEASETPDPMQPPQPSAQVEIDSYECVARGPRHRTVAYRDMVTMPGHAKERADIWGYAKRFWRTLDELDERVAAGDYDQAAVAALSENDDHASDTTLAGDPLGITAKATRKAEKELWELLCLKDLGQGLRWYVATLHKETETLLRLQYDDIGRPRYFPIVPFPRPNSIEGYSVIGHKLITVIEEHTAWRNMDADKGARDLQNPIKRKQGALWDPDEQPLGAKSVIDVREMDEIEVLDMGRDTTGPAAERITRCERTSERIVGITDVAAGVTPTEDRTRGEVELVQAMSNIRVDEAVKNIQETLEEIAQVRHLMWQRALMDLGDEGLDAPQSVQKALILRGAVAPDTYAPQQTIGLEVRGPDVSSQLPQVKFTAAMLEGVFRFKPRGSVETADPMRQLMYFDRSMKSLAELARVNPMIAAILQTPQAAKAIVEQWVRVHHVPDKQSFLGREVMQAAEQQMLLMRAAAMGMPGAGPPGGGAGVPPSAPQGPPPGVRPEPMAA